MLNNGEPTMEEPAEEERVRVTPQELYGPVVRRLSERLSYMRHIPEAEFLKAVQEAAIQFGREHRSAPDPERDKDVEIIARSYLPEALDKKRRS